MSLNTIKQINSSIFSQELSWEWGVQRELAGLKPPDLLMGLRKDLMHGDITREWAKWIIEQFIDNRFFKNESDIVEVFSEVLKTLKFLLGAQLPSDEIVDLAKHLSKLVFERVKQMKAIKSDRKKLSKSIKESLLTIYGDQPRCWLTGYKFSKEAVFNFTAENDEKKNVPLPVFVDRYKPIGLNSRDVLIEVDHLYPFSLGGEDSIDNFKLVCGWANKIKSNHVSGYSIGTRAAASDVFFPKNYYYWTVRLIGLRRKCETEGCKNDITNSELTVCSALGDSKLLTPISMKVVCEHCATNSKRMIRRDCWDASAKSHFL